MLRAKLQMVRCAQPTLRWLLRKTFNFVIVWACTTAQHLNNALQSTRAHSEISLWYYRTTPDPSSSSSIYAAGRHAYSTHGLNYIRRVSVFVLLFGSPPHCHPNT